MGGGAGIFDIILSLPPGSILGMIGPSGCGKTTLVRTLTGLYRPNAGRVGVFGRDPMTLEEHEKVRIGYIPQQMILYTHLSVEENLGPNVDPKRRSQALQTIKMLQSLLPIPLVFLPAEGAAQGELIVRAQALPTEIDEMLQDLNELEKALIGGRC